MPLSSSTGLGGVQGTTSPPARPPPPTSCRLSRWNHLQVLRHRELGEAEPSFGALPPARPITGEVARLRTDGGRSIITARFTRWPRSRTARLPHSRRPILFGCLPSTDATRTPPPGLREDGAVPSSVETCVVCHRLRSSGSRNQTGDIFMCTQCEADADQFLAIQDEIWPPAGVADDPTGGTFTPAKP